MTISTLSFTKLKQGYSRKGQAHVWKETFEGTTHYDWLKNGDSCTIRLSMALHSAGHKVRKVAGVSVYQGKNNQFYIIRANEAARTYFPKVFQNTPDVKKTSNKSRELRDSIAGKKGVLFFRLTNEHKGRTLIMSDFGHADLWDGYSVHYNDILDRTHEIWFWETA